MSRSRNRRRVLATARAVTTVLVAASLSGVTQASASGADGFGPGVALDRQEETGKVGFIGTEPGNAIESGFGAAADAAAVARSFLAAHAGQLGLSGSDLRLIEKHATPSGGTAVRLGQTYSGLPVLGGEFVVTLDGGNDVLSVLGEASPIGKTSTSPTVSWSAAQRTAVAAVAKETKVEASDLAAAAPPELMLYDPRLLSAPGPFQSARLAWVTEVRGTGELTDIGRRVVVDAASGTVTLSFKTIHDAKDRVVCDADNVVAADYPCVAPDRTEASPPVSGDDDDMELAFQFAGDTYDFFFNRFGRDSLDGAGLQLVSTTDYCPDAPNCPYENAFWDGAQMVYGDGFASADDVVGHELTHGFTDFSSSLFYYQQSGAINESMSDVFGEFIDLVNGSGTDTAAVRWLMGEDIPDLGALRDMEDPTAFGDPDRMLSPHYFSDPNELDGGGVHFNSGVNNKAAFLMADGGTFNGQTITGLGITKAARIYYTVNNSMLVSGSDYADLANALRQACTNLIGTDGIGAADCAQVQKIVVATEMDLNPTNSPTSPAALCPAGSTVDTTVLADDLETNSGQLTTGGGVGWNYPQNPNQYPGYDATYTTSGDTNMWGDDPDVVSDTFIRMTNAAAIPADAYLHFSHAFGFEDDSLDAYDGGVLEYSTAGAGGPWTDAGSLFAGPGGANGYTGLISSNWGNPLGGQPAFVRESNGYGSSRATLSSLAGQSVRFRWRIGSDISYGDYGWFLDDIRIVTCVADSTPPDTTITTGPAEGSTITVPTATFEFDSTEAGSTFACSIDAGASAPCLSPLSISPLSDGAHTFSVVATDPAGNPDPSPATRAFRVALPMPPDTAPPQTTITKHPKRKTFSHKAKFAFTSSEAGSTFRCKLDKKRWKPCASPKKYKNLKVGKHKFRVYAIDAFGNADPTPAVWRWRIKP
jgi:bacillolysin